MERIKRETGITTVESVAITLTGKGDDGVTRIDTLCGTAMLGAMVISHQDDGNKLSLKMNAVVAGTMSMRSRWEMIECLLESLWGMDGMTLAILIADFMNKKLSEVDDDGPANPFVRDARGN